MTDLERRALLGDKQAQDECTRQGILLPCWRCSGEAEVNELHTGGKSIYAVACKKHYCGAYGAGSASVPKAIEFWNTRAPIVRCKDCESWRGKPGDENAHCKDCDGVMEADNFCKNFGPKENANEH